MCWSLTCKIALVSIEEKRLRKLFFLWFYGTLYRRLSLRKMWRTMALQLCSLMERRIAADAVTGMLQQEVCKDERQLASLSLLQNPLDFVPAYLLLLKTWIRSCKALCRRSSVFRTSLERRAPSAVPLGGRAALSHAPPGLCKVLNTAHLISRCCQACTGKTLL